MAVFVNISVAGYFIIACKVVERVQPLWMHWNLLFPPGANFESNFRLIVFWVLFSFNVGCENYARLFICVIINAIKWDLAFIYQAYVQGYKNPQCHFLSFINYINAFFTHASSNILWSNKKCNNRRNNNKKDGEIIKTCAHNSDTICYARPQHKLSPLCRGHSELTFCR